jgi:tetratricopeptide (TPR) repeat protein
MIVFMRSMSLASLFIGFGIGFAVMYPLMKNRAPDILNAMPAPFVPGSGAPAPRSNAPPPFDAKRFEQLQETVKKEPRNYNALVELGEIEADQRRFPEAAAWYLKALAANDTVEARNSLGIALFLSNRPDEAIEQFKKVLEKEPGNPEALYDLGIVLAEGKNDPAGAVALWERLVELNPNLPDIDTVKRNIENLKQKRP